jgi:hypothetical protein
MVLKEESKSWFKNINNLVGQINQLVFKVFKLIFKFESKLIELMLNLNCQKINQILTCVLVSIKYENTSDKLW